MKYIKQYIVAYISTILVWLPIWLSIEYGALKFTSHNDKTLFLFACFVPTTIVILGLLKLLEPFYMSNDK